MTTTQLTLVEACDMCGEVLYLHSDSRARRCRRCKISHPEVRTDSIRGYVTSVA